MSLTAVESDELMYSFRLEISAKVDESTMATGLDAEADVPDPASIL